MLFLINLIIISYRNRSYYLLFESLKIDILIDYDRKTL